MSKNITEPVARKIQVGHNIYISSSDNYYQVVGKKNFISRINKNLSANESDSSVDISSLSSPNSQIYWVENFYLTRDVKFWLNLEGQNLLGTTTSTYVTISEANKITPYTIDVWFHNVTPQYDIEEIHNMSMNLDIIFEGISFDLQRIVDRNEISKIEKQEEKCWQIDA
ncbi:MAG: hypothetical protein ACOCQD_00250 [archaeon]